MELGEHPPELQLLIGSHAPAVFAAAGAARPPAEPVREPGGPAPGRPKRAKIGADAAPGAIPYRPRSEGAPDAADVARQSLLLWRVRAE
jgi:hypothetical protein